MINTDEIRLSPDQKPRLKTVKNLHNADGFMRVAERVVIGDVERFDDLKKYLSNLVDFNEKAKPLSVYGGVVITQKKSNALLKEINQRYREMQKIEKRM